MARRIKPYNYSYRIAKRFLTENPKAEFTYVVIYTIKHLPGKHNYSKEGVKRAWNDHQKSRVENPFGPPINFKTTKWPKGNSPTTIMDDLIDWNKLLHKYGGIDD